jgi:hypothetical protein
MELPADRHPGHHLGLDQQRVRDPSSDDQPELWYRRPEGAPSPKQKTA